jgi:hypothetical protein
VAKELLGDAGKIITDGYEAYNILIREGPDKKKPLIILVSCWAHTRRGFTDCEKDWPEECGEILDSGFRGPVVGRKNHYGSKSLRGTEVDAIFYSLIESAKLCGINPQQYLLDATKRVLQDPEDILLPHQLMDF